MLAEVRAAGARFRRVVYTRNRRVMVSVGDGGETLRIHQRFSKAPPEVLRAVGRMYSPGATSVERSEARLAVQRFLRDHPPEPRAARRRIPAADRPHLERLQAEFDRVNAEFFAGTLPRVPLSLSGRMRSRNGHFTVHPPEIVLSRRLCVDAAAGEAERTLRHEMIHLWQHAQGQRPDHGRDFRRMARMLDVHPRATRAVEWKSC